MRRKLIVGNWKMNGSLAANAALLAGVAAGVGEAQAEVGVCPPAPYLAQCQQLLAGSPVGLGAQDVSRHLGGAFTGEVSAPMLLEFGCRYVIIGHCERRGNHAETNQIVADKTVTALRASLVPIVCVGESLAQREAGQTDSHVHAQLAAVLDAIEAADLDRLVVAYEPIWAIGTGVVATPEMAQAVHARIRAQLQNKDAAGGAGVRILYGGSMKPDNAAELLAQPDIDGGLIGGASLKAADFLGIITAAN